MYVYPIYYCALWAGSQSYEPICCSLLSIYIFMVLIVSRRAQVARITKACRSCCFHRQQRGKLQNFLVKLVKRVASTEQRRVARSQLDVGQSQSRSGRCLCRMLPAACCLRGKMLLMSRVSLSYITSASRHQFALLR